MVIGTLPMLTAPLGAVTVTGLLILVKVNKTPRLAIDDWILPLKEPAP